MQSYPQYQTVQPIPSELDIVNLPSTHPFLTFLGVIFLIVIAYWIISSIGAKKGKKAPKKGKKGPVTPAIQTTRYVTAPVSR